MTIKIDDDIQLELLSRDHIHPLFEAIDTNREHLSVFLPWVDKMKVESDFSSYVENCLVLYKEQREVSFTIIYNGSAVGRIGLHYLNFQNKHGAIGYWITKAAMGKGIVVRSCRALMDFGFSELGLHRIELKAAIENTKSQAVPEKLGFT
jgi:ribosomal-protein-serine acetyltransferase